MRTALMLSYYFPPVFDVGGKRAYRFARYLPLFGWRPIIVTAPIPRNRPTDPGEIELPECVQVRREYFPSWWPEPAGRLSDGTIAEPVTRRGTSISRRIGAQFTVPGGRETLFKRYIGGRIAKIAEEVGADVIFATSSPYSALVFGAEVGRRTELPVCLDLRDPWSLNFLQERRAGWVRRAERRIEGSLFATSDRVVLTCEAAAKAYRDLYPQLPEERLQTIYNSYDPALRPEPRIPEGPIKLIHFGNCYGPRRMSTVIRAVSIAIKRTGTALEDIQIINLGRPAEEDVLLARELGLESIYRFRPFVPFEEGVSILAGADLQVLLAYGEETLFIPAKFFDYLLTGVPVLCLAPPSELTDLIDQTRCGSWAAPADVEGTAAIIEKAIAARADGPPVSTPDLDSVQTLSAPKTAERLAAVFDEMVRAQ